MALPAGFTLEESTQTPPPSDPHIDPATGELTFTVTDSSSPALPEGFKLDRDPSNPFANIIGEDGQPLGPEGGYGMNPETGEWSLHGRVTDEAPMERPEVGRGESAWRGLRSSALRGWGDELAAGSGAVGNWLGTQLGLNESTAEFGDIYERLLARERARNEAAFEDHPIAYGVGFVPGMFTGPTFANAATLPQAASHAQRIGRAMKIGGLEGAVAGAGNADDSGNFLERLDDAAIHGTIGGVLGPVADYGVSGVANVGGRITRAVTPHRSPDSGLETLIQRNEVGPPGEMAARAEEMRAGGVEPRLVDVITDEGRTTVREAASKNTPARREVAEAAESTYAAAPDRVAQQARKISAEPRTARQIATAVEEEQRLMGPAFDAVRGNPVEITPEIVEVLGKAQGRAALRQAAKWLPPEDEKQVMGLIRAMNDVNKIDPRMPPAVRNQIAAQILADQKLTVDVVDKWSRAISKAGDTSGMYALAKDMVDVVKGQARAQYPEYDAALNQFAARARVGEAASGTGRFDESSFMRTPPDSYEAAVQGAGREPAALMADDAPTMSEADALAARARDEVVDAAQAGQGRGALNVAAQVARGPAQQQRNRALLGKEGAAGLERGMRAEVDRVHNMQAIDPRSGQQPRMRGNDAMVDGFANAVSSTMAPGGATFWTVVRTAARWLSNGGIRNVDAARLARDAISDDPARVNAAIDFLERRGLQRSRAQRFVSTLGAALAGRATSPDTADTEYRPPASSVRSLMKETQ